MARQKNAKVKATSKVESIANQLVSLPIDMLEPNEYNPNRQSDFEFEMLCKSITEDGYTQPVIALKELSPQGKHRIIDGEHRWRALKHLNYATIEVVLADMDDTQRRIATLRHNLARGHHDIDLSTQVLRDLDAMGQLGWAQEALQLSDLEINRLLEVTTPLDAYGSGDFNESWEHSALGENNEASTAARSAAAIKGDALNRQRELENEGMVAKDVDLVRQTFTVTRQEQNMLQSLTKQNSNGKDTGVADRIMAMVQAEVKAETVASRGDWTTLTFTVPTDALTVIMAELTRLEAIAPNRNPDLTPALQRGLALEYMAVLSSQTNPKEIGE